MRRAGRLAATLLILLVALTSCARGGERDQKLLVYAAASVAGAVGADSAVEVVGAGSQQLASQVREGAPADVLVLADKPTMDGLGSQVEDVRVVARNTLAIAVRPGNPKGVRALADLGSGRGRGLGLTVVLADPSVPAGRYAQQALAKAGVQVSPASLELDVESALQKVVLGQADAAVVYTTDVARGEGVAAVAIPAEHNVAVEYYAGVVARSRHKAAARRYLERLPDHLTSQGFPR